ncbi:MAG: zinc-ribbon domain-containing protein [Lachnospiraceae bacterium]
MFCKKCGSPISDSALRCPKCGAKQGGHGQEVDHRKEENQSELYFKIEKEVHNYKIVAMVICIMCVAAALGLCFYILKNI